MLSGIDVNEYLGSDEDLVKENAKRLSKSTTQESLVALNDSSPELKNRLPEFKQTISQLKKLKQMLMKLLSVFPQGLDKGQSDSPRTVIIKELLYLVSVTLAALTVSKTVVLIKQRRFLSLDYFSRAYQCFLLLAMLSNTDVNNEVSRFTFIFRLIVTYFLSCYGFKRQC
mmetsp:Transcript_71457/g.83127  ORF Transcript_71457/g.83127 Transcript_71457/m.83127 type:complete len:170 (+) Transcript_71457:33-542(+)